MLPVRPVPTDLNDIVSGSLSHFRIRAPQKLISLNIPPDLPEVKADPRRLREVLDNVLDNALKYTPVLAQIWIQCEEIADGPCPQCANMCPGRWPGNRQRAIDSYF